MNHVARLGVPAAFKNPAIGKFFCNTVPPRQDSERVQVFQRFGHPAEERSVPPQVMPEFQTHAMHEFVHTLCVLFESSSRVAEKPHLFTND